MSCADLCCQDMEQGQIYTFHFRYSGLLQVALDPVAVQKAVAADSNFQNPSAVVDKGGLLADASASVSFTYGGQGSVVGQAGQEMQNVINNFWLTGPGTSLVFSGSELGAAASQCAGSSGSIPWWVWLAVGIGVLVVVAPEILSFEALKNLGRSARR